MSYEISYGYIESTRVLKFIDSFNEHGNLNSAIFKYGDYCFGRFYEVFNRRRTNYYLILTVLDKNIEYIERLNSIFNNINISIIGTREYTSSNYRPKTGEEKSLLIKININSKYNFLARFFVFYLVSCLLRLLDANELFVFPEFSDPTDIIKIFVEISNRNTVLSHNFCDNSITIEDILNINNIEIVNTAGKLLKSESRYLYLSNLRQTVLINRIKKATNLIKEKESKTE